MEWHRDWDALFRGHDEPSSATPRLGIDYIKASAPDTALPLRDGVSELRLHQDLARHGIAGVVWNCARALVAFLIEHPGLFAHGHALELGAGSGAVGLALAAADVVNSVTLTDLEAVLPLTRENVAFASRQSAEVATMVDAGRLITRPFCWGERRSDLGPHPTAILCSDCLYEATQYAPLLSTLLELTDDCVQSDGKAMPVVLVAYKQRIPFKERAFFIDASQHFDIEVYASSSSGELVRYFDDDIFVCKLRRRVAPDGGQRCGGPPVKETSSNVAE